MTNHEGSRTQEASQIDDDLDMQPQDQDIHIECQPFRTTPVVLPRGKTIHHPAAVVNKFTSAGVEEKPTPFRSSNLLHSEPKTLLEIMDDKLVELASKQDLQPMENDVNIESQTYRTTPLVLPEPKALYDIGEVGTKHVSVGETQQTKAFRTSPLVLAEAKAVHEREAVNKFGATLMDDNLPTPFRSSTIELPDANVSIHGVGEVGTKFVSVGDANQTKAFRTTPLVLPDANNAENGNKFVAVGDYEQGGNFRTTPLDLPDSN